MEITINIPIPLVHAWDKASLYARYLGCLFGSHEYAQKQESVITYAEDGRAYYSTEYWEECTICGMLRPNGLDPATATVIGQWE